MTPWPHQLYGTQQVLEAIARDEQRIVLQCPTGGGKTKMMHMLAADYLERGKKVILYTNRRMLVDQTSASLMDAGMYHGVRAANYDDEREHAFQVSSIQTETSRVLNRKQWGLHDAELVLIDEAHVQTGPKTKLIIDAHREAGAAIVGFTATPLGLREFYDHLIVAGTMSELRECGALVPAVHYAPDEPDLKAFKKLREGEDLSASQQRSAMMTPTLFGRVSKWYEELNPEHRPCVLFGPGVSESLWFAEKFVSIGIKAAHIDGDDVWIDGKMYKSDSDARKAVADGHKRGDIKVVCNRYVLREGVDWPWIEHIIMAFVAGSLQTYIQVGGRGLRACSASGKSNLTVQDHGGCWHRHGSLNSEREWNLEYTSSIASQLRQTRMRTKKTQEPFLCPRCGRVWQVGTTCHPAHGGCGYELGSAKRSRPVVSTDGTLKEMSGDIFKPRRICTWDNGEKLWEKMYYRSKSEKGSRTFNAAAALFAYENKWNWPDPKWCLMPTRELDWCRLVSEVPMDRLSYIPQKQPSPALFT